MYLSLSAINFTINSLATHIYRRLFLISVLVVQWRDIRERMTMDVEGRRPFSIAAKLHFSLTDAKEASRSRQSLATSLTIDIRSVNNRAIHYRERRFL